MLKAFIKFNRKLSTQLSRKYPKIFSGDVSTDKFNELMNKRLKTQYRTKILECGGADRPFLVKSDIYELHGVDLDPSNRCYMSYDKYFCSSVEEKFGVGEYEIVYSITLLEHVENNHKSILNMSSALKHGGKQLHYVPNKWHLYAIILRTIGHKLQNKLISLLRPEAEEVSGYKAHFHLCTPQEMTKEFEKHFRQTAKVYCFYRANEYFDFFTPLFVLVSLFENFCRKYNLSIFCSGFIIEVSK